MSSSSAAATSGRSEAPLQISGIYPHLCAFNQPEPGRKDMTHGEVGIGAVVPWAGKLWYITYPQHKRTGSNDKLYMVDDDLNLTVRPESVGGTHACRMIHTESNQLIIGPYFIDAEGNVRSPDLHQLEGRLTGVMRHLDDPANWVYFLDMEGKFYEVNVHSLEVRLLFKKPVPGWHAKGGYTGQGRVVIGNNGEVKGGGPHGYEELLVGGPSEHEEDAGVLAEWDGTEWRIIERRQFLDVTGPGGLTGEPEADAPVWSFGWDKRSLILKLLDSGEWHTFRLPKASHTFDPVHGWFTEWPRIREIEPGKPAMCAHGSLFDFPQSFSAENTAGIRPVCTHLRYVPDIGHWNGKVFLAADDSSMMENPLCGQPQSNIWFGSRDELEQFGPKSGWGGVWVDDPVAASEWSVPLLIASYGQRVLHLAHNSDQSVEFALSIGDDKGDWEEYQSIVVPAGGYTYHLIPAEQEGEWLRVAADRDCTASAYAHFLTPRQCSEGEASMFSAIPKAEDAANYAAGIIRPSAMHRGMEWLRQAVGMDGEPDQYSQVDVHLEDNDIVFGDPAADKKDWILEVGELTQDFEVDAASVIVTDSAGQRWRLPKGSPVYDQPFPTGWPRGVREAVSERFLANVHGTFYEVPRTDRKAVPRWQQVKPVATHNRLIADFCTWRGLFVISGTKLNGQPDGHYFTGTNGEGLWFGVIDDLWKFGKPVGVGGPWRDTTVKAEEASDPYLMTGYDRKQLKISHDAAEPVDFVIEVDFDHYGWRTYRIERVASGQTLVHDFLDGFQAHWIRLMANTDCTATAQLTYE